MEDEVDGLEEGLEVLKGDLEEKLEGEKLERGSEEMLERGSELEGGLKETLRRLEEELKWGSKEKLKEERELRGGLEGELEGGLEERLEEGWEEELEGGLEEEFKEGERPVSGERTQRRIWDSPPKATTASVPFTTMSEPLELEASSRPGAKITDKVFVLLEKFPHLENFLVDNCLSPSCNIDQNESSAV